MLSRQEGQNVGRATPVERHGISWCLGGMAHILKGENQIGSDPNRNWYAHVRQLCEMMLHKFNTLEPTIYARAKIIIITSWYSFLQYFKFHCPRGILSKDHCPSELLLASELFHSSKTSLRKPLNFSTKSHAKRPCICG